MVKKRVFSWLCPHSGTPAHFWIKSPQSGSEGGRGRRIPFYFHVSVVCPHRQTVPCAAANQRFGVRTVGSTREAFQDTRTEMEPIGVVWGSPAGNGLGNVVMTEDESRLCHTKFIVPRCRVGFARGPLNPSVSLGSPSPPFVQVGGFSHGRSAS